ncbi:MAG: lipoprotein-releasing system transmembrane subunit LolC [Proteobacteria bacterium]|nr:MAG: lipoprotein-releasing system transmembrane subunit LolC [Pseudomonadota bacterium]
MSQLFRPLALAIGLRYIRARRQKHFISFISLASMLGIAIGVLVLITVLSVMNGFGQALRDRILGVTGHITLSEVDARLEDWQAWNHELQGFADVKAISPFIEQPVMLSKGDEARGAMLYGIDLQTEPRVTDVFDRVEKGDLQSLTAGSYGIALGAELARELNLDIDDPVTVIMPSENSLATGSLPALRPFTVKAIVRLDMQVYDSVFAYINLKDAQEVLDLGEQITGLRVRLTEANNAPMVGDLILSQLGSVHPDIWVSNWTIQQSNLFRAIQAQKSVMFIILLLIIAVAAFNLVSMLVMVVTDKRGDIAILRTLGLSPRRIMGIFMVQGSMIGVIGTLLGVVLGVLLADNLETIVPWLERLLDTHFISAEAYQISELHSSVDVADVIVIALASFFMALLATIYPAWRASKVQPAEALRYE